MAAEYQQWIFNYATGLVEIKTGDRRCTACFAKVDHEVTWGADWITAYLMPYDEPLKLDRVALYCGYDRLHIDTLTTLRPPETVRPYFVAGFLSTRTIRRSHELDCLIRLKSPLYGTISNAGVIAPRDYSNRASTQTLMP